MKRISVTGWVPASEKEGQILDACDLSFIVTRNTIRNAIPKKKVEALETFGMDEELKKVRVTVEIDVEFL